MIVDVCIIGGGSSGIGAAYGFLKTKYNVLLIEKEEYLGGTPISANVNRWEIGPDAPFCEGLYVRLGTYVQLDGETNDYNDSLYRKNQSKPCYGVSFNREKYSEQIKNDLSDVKITIWKSSSFVGINKCVDDRIESIVVEKGGVKEIVTASIFIDATIGAKLCVAKNPKQVYTKNSPGYFLGTDKRTLFNESATSETAFTELNSPDICFEIADKDNNPLPTHEINPWGFAYSEPANKSSQILNPCGMLRLNGYEIHQGKISPEEIQKKATEYFETFRSYSQNSRYKKYGIIKFPKNTGIRESVRVSCSYMLSQSDLGKDVLLPEGDRADAIAIASHSVDIHGNTKVNLDLVEVKTYGIPYGCIIPLGISNVFVVSMSAGFSHIGASSVRLTRTLMQLGYAASKASILALDDKLSNISEVDISKVRDMVGYEVLRSKLKR